MAIRNQEKGQFKPGQSGNPNGRPRKYVSYLKQEGYKKSEITDCVNIMMAMTLDELKQVFKSKEATILEQTIAKAMVKSLERGTLYSIETLITRVYGSPKQEIENTIIEKPLFNAIDLNDENPTEEEEEEH